MTGLLCFLAGIFVGAGCNTEKIVYITSNPNLGQQNALNVLAGQQNGTILNLLGQDLTKYQNSQII